MVNYRTVSEFGYILASYPPYNLIINKPVFHTLIFLDKTAGWNSENRRRFVNGFTKWRAEKMGAGAIQ